MHTAATNYPNSREEWQRGFITAKNIQDTEKNATHKSHNFWRRKLLPNKTDTGFILIDTGYSKNRAEIERELENAGCKTGTLNLLILTHGDFDHCGNCAYLSGKCGTKVAMHSGDRGMVEQGDMFYNRNMNFAVTGLGKLFLFFSRGNLKEEDRFAPDLFVKDGEDLVGFRFDAQVLHFPGHSEGSIGILTRTGDLFCGDLLENTKQPAKNSIVADKKAFADSIKKLKQLKIGTVYPGHGNPFHITQLT
ncbi:MAG: MBL fold metallo-hydrolase [Candidatus Bathyarchaeota archaeon]|nr:MBL fold metallo-hydrolase [Candidatus Bathyarchaeota archaeon]